MTGYRTGTSLIDQASESGIISMLMEVAGILGAMMVGVLIASNIKINIALAPVVNGAEINIQGILDNVMPDPSQTDLHHYGWMHSALAGWYSVKL